jgi:hypothetical protein
MTTYSEFAEKTRSQKIILAHLEAKQKLKIFQEAPFNVGVWTRDMDHFVIGVKVDGEDLEQGSGLDSLDDDQWFYSPGSGKLYIKLTGGVDPRSKSVWVQYRFFFSNIDCILPSNITSGVDVHYDSRISDIGDLKLELDYENTGIALETNSTISLQNSDRYMDEIFDTLIWENNKAIFWSWSRDLPASEAKKIYVGFISDKSFTPSSVRFQLRDQLTQLRQPLDLGRFSEEDGDMEQSMIGKPKRLILGRVDKIRTQGVDKILSGFPLTGLLTGDADRNLLPGTVSGTSGTNTINGLGTNFTTLTVGGRVRVIGVLTEATYEVASIISNTQITVTGTLSFSFNEFNIRNLEIQNNIIEGSGTVFLDQVSPGDRIKVTVNSVEYIHTVGSIESDTSLTTTDEILVGFANSETKNLPAIPYRKRNRGWHIAGHKLREFTTKITSILDFTNIEVQNIGDIEAGDSLQINSNVYTVIRATGNKVRLNQGLIGVNSVDDDVTKIPARSAYVGSQLFVINRDFTLSNTDTDSKLIFNPTAEFNVAPIKSPVVQLGFTSGSRIVTYSGTDVDITTIFKPRDWIRLRSITLPTWYEILDVSQDQILLRTPAVSTSNGLCQSKSPEFINDDSLVTVDCLGLDSGEWIRTPAQAVKWILDQSGFEDINHESFEQSENDCQFTLALYYPSQMGSEFPIVRDMITDINQSCFGSLYLDDSFQFTYSILNADKPLNMSVLRDEDVLGFSVTTKNNIINSILVNYSPFVDTELMTESTRQILMESGFVNEAVGKKERLTVNVYLYHEQEASIIAERWLFFRSLTQTVVRIKSKLNLAGISLNDRIFLDLDRLFKRFGGVDRRKIGIINSISKDGSGTEVEFNDLGNLFNRVPAIAPDATPDYSQGSLDVVIWGYIVDNETETPDPTSESGLGTNLIG